MLRKKSVAFCWYLGTRLKAWFPSPISKTLGVWAYDLWTKLLSLIKVSAQATHDCISQWNLCYWFLSEEGTKQPHTYHAHTTQHRNVLRQGTAMNRSWQKLRHKVSLKNEFEPSSILNDAAINQWLNGSLSSHSQSWRTQHSSETGQVALHFLSAKEVTIF